LRFFVFSPYIHWRIFRLLGFSRFSFLPAKAACPAAEVARGRRELALEGGLYQPPVSAIPQAVPPDKFAVRTLQRVTHSHPRLVRLGLAEIAPGLHGHVVFRDVEGSACGLFFGRETQLL